MSNSRLESGTVLAKAKRFSFTAEQRRRLRNDCGLLDAQIAHLERNLLPMRMVALRDRPTLSEIRKSLRTISVPLAKAAAALDALEAAAFPPLRSGEPPVLMRLQGPRGVPIQASRGDSGALAAWDAIMDQAEAPTIEMALRELNDEMSTIERKLMARGQGRRTAPWQAIVHVENGLQWGWIYHHDPEALTRIERKDLGKAIPPYKGPTLSLGGTFSNIARICYESVGLKDPERAIRNLLSIRRAYAEQCARDGRPVPAARRPGRPRK